MNKFFLVFFICLLVFSQSSFAYFSPDGVSENSEGIVFEGTTDDTYETTISITDPTADRTITVPNASGTISLLGSEETYSGAKTFSSTVTVNGAQTNNSSITVKGTSALQGSVTVSSGTLTATIVTASLNASSGTVVRFPIAASTAVVSGATAGSLKIINDAAATDLCSAVAAASSGGTNVVVCVSDGTNWVAL